MPSLNMMLVFLILKFKKKKGNVKKPTNSNNTLSVIQRKNVILYYYFLHKVHSWTIIKCRNYIIAIEITKPWNYLFYNQTINWLKIRIINCKCLFGSEGRFCFTYPDYFHSGFLLFSFFLWMIPTVSSLVSTESKVNTISNYSFSHTKLLYSV